LIVIELGKDLVNKFVISLETELLEGSFELLRVDNSTAVVVENVKGCFDVLNFFNRDDNCGIVFSSEDLFLRSFGLLGGRLCSGFGRDFAH
jgi:hypothetical protein